MPREGDNSTGEIEITPEMVAAGIEVVENWFLENATVIYDNGGTGDVESLLTALWAVSKKDL